MRNTSKKWLQELSDVLTKVDMTSKKYDFYAVKGLDPEKYLLAVYNQKHTDCWTFSFDDKTRPGTWLQFGHLPNIKFEDVIHSDLLESDWRNDIEMLKHGYETPVQWIRNVVTLVSEVA